LFKQGDNTKQNEGTHAIKIQPSHNHS